MRTKAEDSQDIAYRLLWSKVLDQLHNDYNILIRFLRRKRKDTARFAALRRNPENLKRFKEFFVYRYITLDNPRLCEILDILGLNKVMYVDIYNKKNLLHKNLIDLYLQEYKMYEYNKRAKRFRAIYRNLPPKTQLDLFKTFYVAPPKKRKKYHKYTR